MPPRELRGRGLTVACWVAAALSFAWFLCDGVVRVRSGIPSDFPNYYTAARLTVQGAPLQNFYEYPDFQREISRAGIDHQLGGYIPQTPFAGLPLVPFASLRPVDAKRAWLIVNLILLLLTLWLFSQMTTFSVAQSWLIVFAGYVALRQNFWLGQYYVFLLALLSIAAWGLLRGFERSSVAPLATAFALKLYGAPFFLFLVAKRRLRIVVPAIIALLFFAALELAIFGWHGTLFYVTQVLPRSLAGETLNPYQSANNTFVTLFRTLLIAEPSLNPHPLFDSPTAFAFLHSAFTLSVLLIPVLAAWSRPGAVTKTDIAWWSITLLLVSPNTASYSFVLLALPVVLLLDVWPRRRWAYILAPYILIALPLRASVSPLFPRACLLLFLFIVVGREYLSSIPGRMAGWSSVFVLTLAGFAAILAVREAPNEAAREIAIQPAAIYSGSPVVTTAGMFYESIAPQRYVVERWDGRTFEAFGSDGNAFYPSSPDSGAKVYFETFSDGKSSAAYFDFSSRRYGSVAVSQPDPSEPGISHNGSMLAYLSNGAVYISDGHTDRRLATSAAPRDPAFSPDDRRLLYVSESRIMSIDLNTSVNSVVISGAGELSRPAISPDGASVAYASRQSGKWQIWIKSLIGGRTVQLTDGQCNSTSPAWTPDSSAIVFSSDCGRGLNLPALFRVPVPRLL